MKNSFTCTCVAGLALLSSVWAAPKPVPVKPINKPNILLLLIDDYGTMDTSESFAYTAYKDTGTPLVTAFNTFYHTPYIETLADQGMKFTQAYALPMCSPTRVSLMTGFNSPRHGVTVHLNGLRAIDNDDFTVKTHRGPNNWRYLGMDGTDVTLPQLLSDAGYQTIFEKKPVPALQHKRG